MNDTMVDKHRSNVASDLRQRMRGAVVALDPTRATQDEIYEAARRVWNGAVDRRPMLIALCETVEDVQAAVGVARWRGLALSVRGGGHDWAGRALCDGLVLDLSGMRDVVIKADRRSPFRSVAWRAAAAIGLTIGLGAGSFFAARRAHNNDFDRDILRVSALDQVDETANTDATLTAPEVQTALEMLPTILSKGIVTSSQIDGVHVKIGTGPEVVVPLGASAAQFATALNTTGVDRLGQDAHHDGQADV